MPQLSLAKYVESDALDQFMEATYERTSAWKADFAPHCQAWEQWYVEDLGGKVAFKAIHSPNRFLTANPEVSIFKSARLVDKPQEREHWIPFKNSDNTWSFLSHFGTWLSASPEGKIGLVHKCDLRERFSLEIW
jgi:hypothetical protein